jgi:UDP-N-acetylglucosamine diphosphorylase/glucosamine-1-phosphate N-acetyltransferase
MKKLAIIILAAGKGVRMKSDLPKVFHKINNKPMLQYVLETVQELSPSRTVIIVGHKRELLMEYFKKWPVEFATQDQQLGTGHAVLQAEQLLKDFKGNVLVLAGDVPLISSKTLRDLVDFHDSNNAVITDLTAELADAGSYGRIIRKENNEIIKIVEKKDALPEELQIKEFNSGTFCFDSQYLFELLRLVKTDNAQKEYYLTDTVEICRKKGLLVLAYKISDVIQVLGVNTRDELLEMERSLA